MISNDRSWEENQLTWTINNHIGERIGIFSTYKQGPHLTGPGYKFIFCPKGVALKQATWTNVGWELQFSGNVEVFHYQYMKWAHHLSSSSIVLSPDAATQLLYIGDEAVDYKMTQIQNNIRRNEQHNALRGIDTTRAPGVADRQEASGSVSRASSKQIPVHDNDDDLFDSD